MKILLVYSKNHFVPGSAPSTHSAGVLAKALYDVCTELGEVEYIDWRENPVEKQYDMVLALPHRIKEYVGLAARVFCFPAIAESSYTKNALRDEAKRLGCKVSDCFTPDMPVNGITYFAIGNDFVRDKYRDKGYDPIMFSYGMPGYAFNRLKKETDTTIFAHIATTLGLRKGFKCAVDDFLGADIPNSKLICMGKIQHGEKYWYDFSKSITDKRIEILSFADNFTNKYQNVLRRAHYFLYPSLSEGQPGTVLEAMSLGVIPLLTESSGIDYYPFGKYLCGENGSRMIRKAARIHGDVYENKVTEVRELVQTKYNIESFKDQVREALA